MKTCSDFPQRSANLVKLLVNLEIELLKETEIVEIELQLRFKSVTERLYQLYGPEIRKQLIDGWGLEVARHLSACKKKVLFTREAWANQSMSCIHTSKDAL